MSNPSVRSCSRVPVNSSSPRKSGWGIFPSSADRMNSLSLKRVPTAYSDTPVTKNSSSNPAVAKSSSASVETERIVCSRAMSLIALKRVGTSKSTRNLTID